MNRSTLGPDYHCCLGHKLSGIPHSPFSATLCGSWAAWPLDALLDSSRVGSCLGSDWIVFWETLPDPSTDGRLAVLVLLLLESHQSHSFLVQIQLDPLSAVTLLHLLQSQTITLTLLALNVRDCISVTSSQVKYQKVHPPPLHNPRVM